MEMSDMSHMKKVEKDGAVCNWSLIKILISAEIVEVIKRPSHLMPMVMEKYDDLLVMKESMWYILSSQ